MHAGDWGMEPSKAMAGRYLRLLCKTVLSETPSSAFRISPCIAWLLFISPALLTAIAKSSLTSHTLLLAVKRNIVSKLMPASLAGIHKPGKGNCSQYGPPNVVGSFLSAAQGTAAICCRADWWGRQGASGQGRLDFRRLVPQYNGEAAHQHFQVAPRWQSRGSN